MEHTHLCFAYVHRQLEALDVVREGAPHTLGYPLCSLHAWLKWRVEPRLLPCARCWLELQWQGALDALFDARDSKLLCGLCLQRADGCMLACCCSWEEAADALQGTADETVVGASC